MIGYRIALTPFLELISHNGKQNCQNRPKLAEKCIGPPRVLLVGTNADFVRVLGANVTAQRGHLGGGIPAQRARILDTLGQVGTCQTWVVFFFGRIKE